MKRKIFTLLLSAFFVTVAMAQKPNVIVKKVTVAPEIDGFVDEVWSTAVKQNFAVPFKTETPTLGELGESTWQAVWTDEGIYLLLTVKDDYWYPSYITGGNNWEYDKPEVYFDVNAEKNDGKGAKDGMGHYQFAPPATETNIDGTPGTDNAATFAFKVADPTYKVEYFIPFTKLKDADGSDVDISQPIGFDITLIDRDPESTGRMRLDWANNGTEAYGGVADESWASMDGAGLITLTDADAMIDKTATAPEIDGKVDDIWANATANPINKNFWRTGEAPWPAFEQPTLGESTWKALWNDDGLYILVQVDDDNWYPHWVAGGADSWMFDKPELYFDINVPRVDATGGHGDTKGSFQIAPGSDAASIDGTPMNGTAFGVDYTYAYLVTEPQYNVEYFLPWDIFVDKNDVAFNKTLSMGFDITLIDQDPGTTDRARANWKNDGTGEGGNESWNNMDSAGIIALFGASAGSDVESISITGGNSITADNGTLQLVANVEPSDAAQAVKWVVENGTGRAKVDAKGLLTGLMDGTVLVKAIAKDGTEVEGKITVTISKQNVTLDEINILKNSNFDQGTDFKQNWGGAGTVEDSWYNLVCTTKVNIWDTMFGQPNVPIADGETPYTVKFKAFASADMVVPMLFEDRSNGNNKTVTSLVEYRDNGYGKWDVPVTTEPTWFTIDVIFSAMAENSAWELNYQVGMADGTLSIDSIMMFADADLDKLGTSVKTLSNVNKVKLYPNPVQTELTISKIAVPNSKVSVYNAVGQKLMEKTANGTQAKFDVANLRKGMYFVRFSDGSSEKFLKQ